MGQERYRVWLADDKQWQPGPVFPHLALAIDKARRLAVTRWVAIELPTREWHVFDESKTTRLGPPQFARGSNLDLSDRASQATQATPATADEQPRTREYPRASTGNPRAIVGSGNSTYRVTGLRNTRPLGTRSDAASPANTGRTHSGLGPESVQRAPGSTRATGSQRIQRPSESQPVQKPDATRQTGSQRVTRRRPSPSTSRSINERRANERFAADEVLADAACYIDGQRVDVTDVSETGLQLATPPRIRLRIGSTVVLAFSDRHGRFDLIVKIIWVRANHIGVLIEDGSANLVGKMFLRKLIAQLVTKREARKKRDKRPR